MLQRLLIIGLLQVVTCQKSSFQPRPGVFPLTGDDTIAGGIFSISLPDLAGYLARNGGLAAGSEAVSSTASSDPGSGPYPAHMFTDSSLPKHTLYAPEKPPKEKMPFIAFGNGACGTNGAGYKNFLLEIASHGYVIAADGDPKEVSQSSLLGAGFDLSAGGQSKYTDMVSSVDWAIETASNKTRSASIGEIDIDKIATMGHSCGGLEAMSVAYHNPKIKFTVMLNIGIFQDSKRYLLKELRAPVAWFIGGVKDMGYSNVSSIAA
jgi:dienelactone hydrolase